MKALLITFTIIGASITIEMNPKIICMENPSINTLNCGATRDNIPRVAYIIILIPIIGRAIFIAITNISIKVFMDKGKIIGIVVVLHPPRGRELYESNIAFNSK